MKELKDITLFRKYLGTFHSLNHLMLDKFNLPQFCSSLPSMHSTTLLHLAEIGTHCLFEQVNCVEEHPKSN